MYLNRVRVMVFNATFYNILVIIGGNGVPGEKPNDFPQVTDKFYHIMQY